jgi:two-component system, chemotaxis family, chemotaxis protein CheY
MKKIFAVDDSATIRKFIEEALVDRGYHVETAEDGNDAIGKIHEYVESIDLFIIDIIMTGMDGIELITKIRDIEIYKLTPIIVLTSMTDESAKEVAKSAGANCWIDKPFDIEELVEAIRHFFNRDI